MSDTIFYKGKLKRGRSPSLLFEKMIKEIKKLRSAKNWTYSTGEKDDYLLIRFNDEKSEDFLLDFNEKGEFNGFCKVYFPLEGESFEDDDKCEFKALLDVLYKGKSMYSYIDISDDYGLAESYWDSKRFLYKLRDLTAEEESRVRRLYSEGNNTHEQLLRAIMAEDMEMSVEDLREYLSIYIQFSESSSIASTLETYLYETTAFDKEGRLCEMPEELYYDLSKVSYSVFAFVDGISWVFWDGTGPDNVINLEKRRCFSQKDSQVGLLFREKFASDFLKEKDELQKCLLVYQYFVSVYDCLGFVFVGRAKKIKTAIETFLEEYGGKKGTFFITCYCTSKRYIFTNSNEEKKSLYCHNLVQNAVKRYGLEAFEEYLKFKKNEAGSIRFQEEIKVFVRSKLKYIDDLLVL